MIENDPRRALKFSTAELHKLAGGSRSHADVIRTFNAGLAELTSSGVLVTTDQRTWYAGREMVAMFGTYTDAHGREQTCLWFGPWMCLAMALKVSQPETKRVLHGFLKRSPLYQGDREALD